MDIIGPMIRVLGEKVVSVGVEKLKSSKEFKNTQLVLRQRLFRELAFNYEINRLPRIQPDVAIAHYETKVLFELMDQPFLLSDLFPRELDNGIVERLDPRFVNKHIKMWIGILETEADVIEKLAMRIKTHQLRKKLDINLGSKSYVQALTNVLFLSLKQD